MAFRTLARLRTPLLFALGGVALAIWLTIFVSSPNRPVTPIERADRLAAQNLLAGSLGAETPPSPAHWAQLWIWQNPQNGVRYPLARPAAAISIAIFGGRANFAAIALFGLGAAATGWILLSHTQLGTGKCVILTALAFLSVAHGRAWQFSDPYPYAVLAAGAVALGGWLSFRSKPADRFNAIFLGVGLCGLALCHPALAIMGGLGVAVDACANLFAKKKETPSPPQPSAWLFVLIPLLVLVGAAALRNAATTGSPFRSPETSYQAQFVSAPRWLWEPVRPPQPDIDPVMERFDELVAIPAARFDPPVIRLWWKRLIEGGERSVGILLAMAALSAALALPGSTCRPAWLLVSGLSAIALFRYSFTSSWWPLFTAPALLLAARGLEFVGMSLQNTASTNRLIAGLFVGQILMLPQASQGKPSAAEESFANRIAEIAKKIQETAGQHLVFVEIHPDVDGNIEPANLPRDWKDAPILFARDLGSEKNSELAAALPQRTPWKIVVFREQIGLKRFRETEKIPDR